MLLKIIALSGSAHDAKLLVLQKLEQKVSRVSSLCGCCTWKVLTHHARRNVGILYDECPTDKLNDAINELVTNGQADVIVTTCGAGYSKKVGIIESWCVLFKAVPEYVELKLVKGGLPSSRLIDAVAEHLFDRIMAV